METKELIIPIAAIFAIIILLIVPNIPFTESQFYNQVTDLNYLDLDSLDGSCSGWIDGVLTSIPCASDTYVIGVEYFFPTDNVSDLNSYNNLETTPHVEALSDFILVKASDGKKLIDEYVTQIGIPGVTLIPDGVFAFRTYASIDSSTVGQTFIDVNVFKVDDANVETSLFSITTNQLIDGGIPHLYSNFYTLLNAVDVNATDRLAVKFYAWTTSVPDRNVGLWYGSSNYYSYIRTTLPSTSSVDLTNYFTKSESSNLFVPYVGATNDLNMFDRNVVAKNLTSKCSDFNNDLNNGVQIWNSDNNCVKNVSLKADYNLVYDTSLKKNGRKTILSFGAPFSDFTFGLINPTFQNLTSNLMWAGSSFWVTENETLNDINIFLQINGALNYGDINFCIFNVPNSGIPDLSNPLSCVTTTISGSYASNDWSDFNGFNLSVNKYTMYAGMINNMNATPLTIYPKFGRHQAYQLYDDGVGIFGEGFRYTSNGTSWTRAGNTGMFQIGFVSGNRQGLAIKYGVGFGAGIISVGGAGSGVQFCLPENTYFNLENIQIPMYKTGTITSGDVNAFLVNSSNEIIGYSINSFDGFQVSTSYYEESFLFDSLVLSGGECYSIIPQIVNKVGTGNIRVASSEVKDDADSINDAFMVEGGRHVTWNGSVVSIGTAKYIMPCRVWGNYSQPQPELKLSIN